MDILWSISTTIRNPDRIPGFFMCLSKIRGEIWNNATQVKFQSMLIQDRLYTPTNEGLSSYQINILNDASIEMTYEQANNIFNSKNYTDPPMRGRTSFDPIEKMGLVNIVDNRIKLSQIGEMYLENRIDFGEVILNAFLKWQYPNPLTSGLADYNTKPFINTLRVIKLVNEICEERGLKSKGISREEFGIFVLSLKRYESCIAVANLILEFRQAKDSIQDDTEKKEFVKRYILEYLNNYQDPLRNTIEYSDNMIRCLRLTKFIYVRGNGYYIDLEPRRKVEIESLLNYDNGSSLVFTKDNWIEYMGSINSYILPWESNSKLIEIQESLISEIADIQQRLNIRRELNLNNSNDNQTLKENISELRNYRTELQTKLIRVEYHKVENIDNTILQLSDIRSLRNKPSIELERLANLSMNILNDAISIKPNYPVGDDNEPTFTAPSKVPDIECFYEDFNTICEVTMLTSLNQWFNEGQPVMRHLREFQILNNDKPAYCLFIAPKLHQDTLNTFWNAVKYEYQGEKQRIIPITITQLMQILEKVKELKQSNKYLKSTILKDLFDECIDVNKHKDSHAWKQFIDNRIDSWSVR